MTLIPNDLRIKLRNNANYNLHCRSRAEGEIDFMPVVKLFCPWGGATWLLSELDPDDDDTAFGLCDLGLGCPELGYVRLSELESLRGPGGLRIERDLYFKAQKSLLAYAEAARIHQRIIV